MSLLTDAMEKTVYMNKTVAADGYGGSKDVWSVGTAFDAAYSYDNSKEAKTAQKNGVTDVYTIVTKRSINLQYHDVVKRMRDGKVFRVTSDGDDNLTPKRASIDMRAVSAEEWEIPTNA